MICPFYAVLFGLVPSLRTMMKT